MGEIIIDILNWHFLKAPKAILRALFGLLHFGLEYFSLPLLLKTFFSHWKRYSFSYGKRIDFKQYFEAFTFNAVSRMVGAACRTFFIILGLVSEIFIFLAGIVVLAVWIILPLASIYLFFFGIKLIL